MFTIRVRGVLAVAGGLVAVLLTLLGAIEPVRALEDAELLRGRTGPQKYVCNDQCTAFNVGGCYARNPAVNCTGMNVGAVCGTTYVTKRVLKYCAPDASGFRPCINNGTGKCYTLRDCTCSAVVAGVSTCTDAGGVAQNSAAVTCATNQCGANPGCARP